MAEENKAMELHGEESEKKKYISDVLDIDKLIEEYGNKIMLIAGVGSGKSTWVKDVLTQKGNVLFITSRRAKVDEDIAHSCFTSFVREQDGQRENLITNAKLGYILINAHADMQMTVDNFLNCYEYIVVDEIHSMASDSTFARSSFDVLTFIEYAAEQGHKVIVMTGTPEPVQSYFQNNGWHIEDYRKICNYVKPEAIKYIYKEKRADVIKEALEENKKVIYFVNNTVTITETIREVLDKRIGEIEKIAVIVSDEKRKDMDAALKEKFPGYNEEINDQVYTSLIQNQVLPEECEILISTSRLKEGVDILNENACVICDNHILSNLIQFFGRVRVGGGKNMRFLLSKMHDMLDYLQPNMRRLYAGTETPEDILALSEAADRAGIGNEVYVIMPGRSVRQGDIVTGEAITRDANRLAYEWMRPGIIVANRIH